MPKICPKCGYKTDDKYALWCPECVRTEWLVDVEENEVAVEPQSIEESPQSIEEEPQSAEETISAEVPADETKTPEAEPPVKKVAGKPIVRHREKTEDSEKKNYVIIVIIIGVLLAYGTNLVSRFSKISSRSTKSSTKVEVVQKQAPMAKEDTKVPNKPQIMETVSKTFNNGNKYVGTIKDGKMHGKGTYTFKQGTKYVGEFVNGRMEGNGVMTTPDGTVSEGTFKNGALDGYGTIKWKNGTHYEGETKAGRMEGKGKLWYYDGSYYEGEFYRSRRHGQGTYIDKHGKKQTGRWENGYYMGK